MRLSPILGLPRNMLWKSFARSACSRFSAPSRRNSTTIAFSGAVACPPPARGPPRAGRALPAAASPAWRALAALGGWVGAERSCSSGR
eukprot:5540237-Pyramimonas_sp.AAC.1